MLALLHSTTNKPVSEKKPATMTSCLSDDLLVGVCRCLPTTDCSRLAKTSRGWWQAMAVHFCQRVAWDAAHRLPHMASSVVNVTQLLTACIQPGCLVCPKGSLPPNAVKVAFATCGACRSPVDLQMSLLTLPCGHHLHADQHLCMSALMRARKCPCCSRQCTPTKIDACWFKRRDLSKPKPRRLLPVCPLRLALIVGPRHSGSTMLCRSLPFVRVCERLSLIGEQWEDPFLNVDTTCCDRLAPQFVPRTEHWAQTVHELRHETHPMFGLRWFVLLDTCMDRRLLSRQLDELQAIQLASPHRLTVLVIESAYTRIDKRWRLKAGWIGSTCQRGRVKEINLISREHPVAPQAMNSHTLQWVHSFWSNE